MLQTLKSLSTSYSFHNVTCSDEARRVGVVCVLAGGFIQYQVTSVWISYLRGLSVGATRISNSVNVTITSVAWSLIKDKWRLISTRGIFDSNTLLCRRDHKKAHKKSTKKKRCSHFTSHQWKPVAWFLFSLRKLPCSTDISSWISDWNYCKLWTSTWAH